jgi:hypothetical protein
VNSSSSLRNSSFARSSKQSRDAVRDGQAPEENHAVDVVHGDAVPAALLAWSGSQSGSVIFNTNQWRYLD